MTDNNKPLGEWTLVEVKEYCQTHRCYVDGNICMLQGSICPTTRYPALWEFDNDDLCEG